jgi:hypothetical protein
MYLRHTTRRKDGKAHTYWQLVRSVRIGRRVVQQTVAHLGELDPHGRARARALARSITGELDAARGSATARGPSWKNSVASRVRTLFSQPRTAVNSACGASSVPTQPKRPFWTALG